MNRLKKSLLSLMSILLITTVIVGLAGAVDYVVDIPDHTKTLPANDGQPDGCNSSRFKCVMDGKAVLDKQTGITWARNANIGTAKPWQEAVDFSRNFVIGNQKGWRLPTLEELSSLLDTLNSAPALPEGHPFQDVQLSTIHYWTSTVP